MKWFFKLGWFVMGLSTCCGEEIECWSYKKCYCTKCGREV